jgi:hypothetical protein
VQTLGRTILYDQPGTGASDPVSLDNLSTLEQWTDIISVVLDEVGSTEAAPFDDRGGHELKGVPGERRLFAVA